MTEVGERTGFTLIELLIVVAIIAILAAIAVPNFLEAQTRSKISRVKADIRSISTALEAYSVDWTGYPLGWRATALGNFASGNDSILFGLSKLTTPVAYMSSLPRDPFTAVGNQIGDRRWTGLPPRYDTFGTHQWKPGNDYGSEVAQHGYVWLLWSIGPIQNQEGPNIMRVLLSRFDPQWIDYFFPYDPTNGTVSFGYIMRTNKGEYPD